MKIRDGLNSTKASPPSLATEGLEKKVTKLPKAHIISNSLTRNLNLSGLTNSLVETVFAPTLKETQEELSKLDSTDTLVIHEITNDIGTNEQSATKCAKELTRLAIEGTKKAKHVIISLATPQRSPQKNDLVYLVNNIVSENLIGIEEHNLLASLQSQQLWIS